MNKILFEKKVNYFFNHTMAYLTISRSSLLMKTEEAFVDTEDQDQTFHRGDIFLKRIKFEIPLFGCSSLP